MPFISGLNVSLKAPLSTTVETEEPGFSVGTPNISPHFIKESKLFVTKYDNTLDSRLTSDFLPWVILIDPLAEHDLGSRVGHN